ncbi:MAG: hypothetical protein ACHQJ6_02610 [Candidatus Berkiellales bacterium]
MYAPAKSESFVKVFFNGLALGISYLFHRCSYFLAEWTANRLSSSHAQSEGQDNSPSLTKTGFVLVFMSFFSLAFMALISLYKRILKALERKSEAKYAEIAAPLIRERRDLETYVAGITNELDRRERKSGFASLEFDEAGQMLPAIEANTPMTCNRLFGVLVARVPFFGHLISFLCGLLAFFSYRRAINLFGTENESISESLGVSSEGVGAFRAAVSTVLNTNDAVIHTFEFLRRRDELARYVAAARINPARSIGEMLGEGQHIPEGGTQDGLNQRMLHQ